MKDTKNQSIGNKAYNLLILKEKGFNIPRFETFSVDEIKKLNFEDLVEKIFLEIKDKKNEFILRSSAIGEDGEDTSFAGIFESVKIKNKEDIKKGLTIIFNSLNSNKLNSYLKSKNINEKPKLSIILQEFVEGDISGVLFSLKNEFIINSNYGTAESIVQGETCDEYIINNKNKIINKNLNKDSLNKIEIKIIVDVGKMINKLFNKRQDIDWTIKNSKISKNEK